MNKILGNDKRLTLKTRNQTFSRTSSILQVFICEKMIILDINELNFEESYSLEWLEQGNLTETPLKLKVYQCNSSRIGEKESK